MSVWKKASKLNQKTHRERHQPEGRKHLGLLEKHNDYVKRAQDYNEKKATLKILHKKVLNKNPDEFYYHMINSKVVKGKHHEKETASEDTPEQLQLMRSQDIRYVTLKRNQEAKKIEKLQAQLHLTGINLTNSNKHVHFGKEKETIDNIERLSNLDLKEVDIEALVMATKKRQGLYLQLAKRIKREKELAIVQRKIEIKKQLENKKLVLKPKRIRKGSKEAAPVYEWKYERKR